MNELIIEISANIQVYLNNKIVNFGIVPGTMGKISLMNLLDQEDMPEKFCELTGFRRLRSKELDNIQNVSDAKGTLREIMIVSKKIVPILFALACNKPLLWICSRNHAIWAEKFLGKRYEFKILRGSLAIPNKYPQLKLQWDNTGGSDDEHIVMMKEKNDGEKSGKGAIM